MTITATVTDSAGNSGTASLSAWRSVLRYSPLTPSPSMTSSTPRRKGADLSISGTSNQPAGAGNCYAQRAKLHHHCRCFRELGVTVPASAVGTLSEATYTVTAAATDVDGNSGSANITCRLIPRYRASPLTLWQRTVLLTPPEAGQLKLSAGRSRVPRRASTVTVTLGGATYTATVRAGFKLECRCFRLRRYRRWAAES